MLAYLRIPLYDFIFTTIKTTFTSKYRPWELVALFKVPSLSLARKIENFIKKQKSRRLIEYLIDPKNIPEGKLAQLVRVPVVRD